MKGTLAIYLKILVGSKELSLAALTVEDNHSTSNEFIINTTLWLFKTIHLLDGVTLEPM